MKLLHISDLHIGKKLGNHSITEDMRHILFDCVLGEAVELYSPDGLIISGDLYDVSSPSQESIRLLDSFLTKAAEISLPVFIVSGNHDSAYRVSYGRDFFCRHGVHISCPYTAESGIYTAECAGADIALLPFVSLEQLRACYPEEKFADMTQAVGFVLKKAGLPRADRPCVLAAHQTVGRGDFVVGKLDCVSPEVFDGFVYTALGHYHSPHSCAENVRYCGAPLAFSRKDAAKPQRFIDVITVEDDKASVLQHEIVPLRKTRIITGTAREILSDRFEPSDDFIYFTLTGESDVENMAERLSEKYPNYVNIEYGFTDNKDLGGESFAEVRHASFRELFSGFGQFMRGCEPDEELTALAEEIFREAERSVNTEGTEHDT